MISVGEWMRAHGKELADVYDVTEDIGRAWGLSDPEYPCFEGMDEVNDWIIDGVRLERVDCDGDLVADVWSFAEEHIGLLAEYAEEWTCLTVDETDDGIANGVDIVMYLMSGEAAVDSYPWLAERIAGGAR